MASSLFDGLSAIKRVNLNIIAFSLLHQVTSNSSLASLHVINANNVFKNRQQDIP